MVQFKELKNLNIFLISNDELLKLKPIFETQRDFNYYARLGKKISITYDYSGGINYDHLLLPNKLYLLNYDSIIGWHSL